MISICSSIYRSPGLVYNCISDIFSNASNPDDIEIVCVHDESDYDKDTATSLAAAAVGKRVKTINVTKSDKMSYIDHNINFYQKESIFSQEDIDDMKNRLGEYANGKLKCIWMPPANNYNKAVKEAQGDVVMIFPLDLRVPFDISCVYKKFKEIKAENGRFAQFGFGSVKMAHGIKIFDKGMFDSVQKTDTRYSDSSFGCDPRWFVRAFAEDDFNDKMVNLTKTSPCWQDRFKDNYLFQMQSEPFKLEYLVKKCLHNNSISQYFMNSIKAYKGRINE